jgi:NADH-quinone oxidoreductase subunit A
MLENYTPIFLMIGVAMAFGIVMSKVNEILGPKRRNSDKYSTYESGMEPLRSTRERFSIKYYMVAMLFIVFDIEIVFMYPWAVTYKHLGFSGFIVMASFIFVLLLGYYFVWKKGALEWD